MSNADLLHKIEINISSTMRKMCSKTIFIANIVDNKRIISDNEIFLAQLCHAKNLLYTLNDCITTLKQTINDKIKCRYLNFSRKAFENL